MRRILLGLVVAVAAVVLYPTDRASAEDWCWNDPTLSINGRAVHFLIGAPLPKRELVRNSTLTVVVPSNVTANLAGAGVQNFPMSVTISSTGLPWSGIGPILVTATATVTVTPDVATRFRANQASVGILNEVGGVGGVTMLLSLSVQ